MSPFYGSQIDHLSIEDNSALTTKFVTSGNSKDYGSIHVNLFNIEYFPRTGFGDIFKYFSNELTDFSAAGLDLYKEDTDISGEFLPGLSAHTNLKYLSLYQCNISGRLDSDTWIPKELERLEEIMLRYNKISEVGENVFDFIQGGEGLTIDLENNKLNESSFHPNSGISRAGRKTYLDLMYNQITSLPAPIFEPFLDAHPENSLYLAFNSLICDERLSWLKSRRDELRFRVRDPFCSNDSGHTAFDSDLIPDLKNKN